MKVVDKSGYIDRKKTEATFFEDGVEHPSYTSKVILKKWGDSFSVVPDPEGDFVKPKWDGTKWVEDYVEPDLTADQKVSLYTSSEQMAFSVISEKCMNDAGKLDLFGKRLEILSKSSQTAEELKFIAMVNAVEKYISNVMTLYNQYKRSVIDAQKSSELTEPDYSAVEVPCKYKHCRYIIDADYAGLFPELANEIKAKTYYDNY